MELAQLGDMRMKWISRPLILSALVTLLTAVSAMAQTTRRLQSIRR